MTSTRSFNLVVLGLAFALAGCGGSSSSSGALPAQSGSVRVRIVDGAPLLEALIGGVPVDIGIAYLQVDGATVASSFAYGTMTQFLTMSSGTHSLKALDDLGYAVGPLKTTSLSSGKRYTLILIGAYPNYRVLTFEEPANSSGAQLSLYEASPTVPQSAFGSFQASTHSNFKQLGSAKLGEIATVSLGKSVTNFGGYAGSPAQCTASNAFRNCLTPAQVDSFDAKNALPFHVASRFSLFLFDPKAGSSVGPLFASLDR
ncbi:MAG: DUF4397 domain-containing protein [Candidatus Eremiobacteraeota bacterium]|nr:DUF4397 domain-containing protein [Candidatus Eremiobacteraeota bacterium]